MRNMHAHLFMWCHSFKCGYLWPLQATNSLLSHHFSCWCSRHLICGTFCKYGPTIQIQRSWACQISGHRLTDFIDIDFCICPIQSAGLEPSRFKAYMQKINRNDPIAEDLIGLFMLSPCVGSCGFTLLWSKGTLVMVSLETQLHVW